MGEHSQHVQGVGVTFIGRQDLLIELLRVRQPARLVVPQCRLEQSGVVWSLSGVRRSRDFRQGASLLAAPREHSRKSVERNSLYVMRGSIST
jgi:hypothetical protein